MVLLLFAVKQQMPLVLIVLMRMWMHINARITQLAIQGYILAGRCGSRNYIFLTETGFGACGSAELVIGERLQECQYECVTIVAILLVMGDGPAIRLIANLRASK